MEAAEAQPDLATAGGWARLNPPLCSAVLTALTEDFGFAAMTPVQAATIPLLLTHKDVAVEARTGSGKTLAFLVPVLEVLMRRETPLQPQQVGAIVMTPTRELAGQVFSVCAALVAAVRKAKAAEAAAGGGSGGGGGGGDESAADSSSGLRCLQLVGGTSVTDDETAFLQNGGNIVVGTPGRIEDTQKRVRAFDTRKLEVLILDEADRMLDMGFERAVSQILGKLPKQRRTGLFSATQTQAVADLVRAGLRNAVKVRVKDSAAARPAAAGAAAGTGGAGHAAAAAAQAAAAAGAPQRTPDTLENYYVLCEARHKLAHLAATLQALGAGQRAAAAGAGGGGNKRVVKVIVYFLTCACVDYFAKVFAEEPTLQAGGGGGGGGGGGIRVLALHGKMKQNQRTKIYREYIHDELPAAAAGAAAAAGGGAAGQDGVMALFTTDLAARGLDIPAVDWVIQYDPPQNPDTFVHRVGRTARMGRSGKALVYLLPQEDAYVQFMQVRRVPLLDFEPHARKALLGAGTDDGEGGGGRYEGYEGLAAKGLALLSGVKAVAKQDRDVFEKGERCGAAF
eukprot:SAG22_NODE_145_length_17656_cov_33.457367_12_plen_566_part_00